MPGYTVAAFNAGNTSREKLHQLPIGCACQCLRHGARHERHVAGDERVFLGVSELSKKSFRRVIGRQALALENLIGGFEQWPEQLCGLNCPDLAAVQDLRDLDVLA